MTAVGLLGILLSFLAFPFSAVEKTPTRISLFFLGCLAHNVAAVVYYFYTQTASADTVLYYYDPYDMFRVGVQPGTLFVVHFVQTLRGAIGGSYLDYFMIFQAFGFWGIVFLMRTVEEIYIELDVPQPRMAYFVTFLPGIYFWTSAIGKDAPLFLGASMAVWAAMQLRRRFPAFAFGVLLMTLIRPHIALVALVALATAAFFDRRAKGYVKILLLLVALLGSFWVAQTLTTSLNINVTSAESLSEFFSRQSTITDRVAGTTNVAAASFPFKLFSLLARPFFIDAQGAFGLVASVENIFILLMIGTILRRWRDSRQLAGQVFFLRFALIFAVALTLLLAMVYYNVGLGLRQKMMFMPGLITFYVALLAMRRVRERPQVLGYAT
jgi:hypothetical protein